MMFEGTPACAAGRLHVSGCDNRIGNWLRGEGSNPDLLVQSQAWCQFHHLALVWTEGFEPSPPAPEAGVLHVEHHVQLVPTEGFEPALAAF